MLTLRVDDDHGEGVSVMSFRVGLDTSALDPTFKEHAQRGIGRYVQELDRFFSGVRDPKLEVRRFTHDMFSPPRIIDAAISYLPYGRQTVRQQLLFPLSLRARSSGRFSIVHFPAHMDAPAWSLHPYIVTVLDLIPLVCADLYKADNPSWRFHLARWLEMRAIRNASHLLAISENTARDVHRILGVPRDRVTVTPLGVDDSFFQVERDRAPLSVRSRLSLDPDRPIVLYVGGIDPRKNIGTLLRVAQEVCAARRESRQVPPLFVLAGRIDRDRQYPKLLRERSERGLESDVKLVGYVSDADLKALYGVSSAFLFPSLYEGFGLPPLEAMAAGVPVVSSSASAMPEVLGNAGLLIDPMDVQGFVRALLDILGSTALQDSLREEGRARARRFTWERTGRETLAAYRRIRDALPL